MSAAYVRSYYAVPYKVGDRLTVDGRPGVLVSFPGHYLGVRFTSRAHPTWRVERTTTTTDTSPSDGAREDHR